MPEDYINLYFAETRLPNDDPEGIKNQYSRDGKFINTGAIAVTETEILDLISEGEIDGLVTGNYSFLGLPYEVGYRTGYDTAYDIPIGLTDTDRWLRSVFWNQIPLVDSDNKYNFSNISVSYSVGTQNGEIISTNDELTATRVFGERLRSVYLDDQGDPVGDNEDYIKIYRIFNPNCVAIKLNVRFGLLYKRNITEEEYGDVEVTTVEYTIEYRGIFTDGRKENWSPAQKETVAGKLSSPYIKSTRVNFNRVDALDLQNFAGWELRIIRLTPDSIYSTIANSTTIDSITEVYGNKFLFPNSAMVRSKFNAEFFSQVPERAFDVRLLKVKIPSNYDPFLRTYTGDWDGTFKAAKYWTDNPAWCYYDLITNGRYGLGKYIGEDYFDKWTLYEIAKYCDTLVPDGFGGLEPRFVCNLLLNTRAEAFTVINDMASIFRSIVYYAAGSLYLTQDREVSLDDYTMQFNNTDVADGNFVYASSPKNSRNTVALVRYNDKANFYKPAVEYIQDIDLIKKYGRRDFEFTAFGCTSRGQAKREASYILYTQNYQSETINFSAGPQAALLRPGDIIKVYDVHRNDDRLGGRLFSGVSGTDFYLDSNLTGYFSGRETSTFNLYLTSPTYNFDPSLVSNLDGSDYNNVHPNYFQKRSFTLANVTTDTTLDKTKIILPSALDATGYSPVSFASWIIEDSTDVDNQSEYWRIVNVTEKEDNFKYDIFGLRYDIDKYLFVESGLKFARSTQPNNTIDEEPALANLILKPTSDSLATTSSAQFSIDYSFFKIGPSGQNKTTVILAKTGTDFTVSDLEGLNYYQYSQAILPPDSKTGSLSYTDNGQYYFRVYNLTDNGLLGDNYSSYETGINYLRTVDDIVISSLVVDGDSSINTYAEQYTGVFTGISPKFTWQVGSYAQNISENDNLYFRVTIRPPSNTSTPSSLIYFEHTGLKFGAEQPFNYTFDMEDNRALPNGPYRSFDVVVEAHDSDGNSSAGGNFAANLNASGYNDSNFTTAFGYDIMYANIKEITGLYFSTGASISASFASGDFHTAQMINPDGSVSIQFVTGKYFYPNTLGGFLYHSTGFFSGLDLYDTGRSDLYAAKFELNGINDYPFMVHVATAIPATQKSGYFAYSLFDAFDDIEDNFFSGLNVSNIINIDRYNYSVYQTGNFVGINTQSPRSELHVNGLLRIDNTVIGSATSLGEYLKINVTGADRYILLYQ